MKLKSAQTEEFAHYSQFQHLKEFNVHIEQWLAEYKNHFSKGELIGLKRLLRFSAKIPGVCNAKIGTILKAIHEEYHDHGISRSTFKRMLLKAKKLGLLMIYETTRKNGSQTSNLYVFNRFPANELPKKKKMSQPNQTNSLLKQKDQNIKKRNNEKLDETFTSDRVPTPFVQLAKNFFPDAKVIEEYWHMVQISAYKNNYETDYDNVLYIAISAFQQMIRKWKMNTVKNPIAYFYGITMKKFEELFLEELYEMGFGL